MKRRMIAAGLLAAATLGVASAATSAPLNDRYEARVVQHINAVRTSDAARVSPVRPGPLVDAVAERWAQHLAEIGTLEHQDMGDVMDATNATAAGEVLARVSPGATPGRVVKLWMASPPHMAVIVNPIYERIGVGQALGNDGQRYVVVDFVRHGY